MRRIFDRTPQLWYLLRETRISSYCLRVANILLQKWLITDKWDSKKYCPTLVWTVRYFLGGFGNGFRSLTVYSFWTSLWHFPENDSGLYLCCLLCHESCVVYAQMVLTMSVITFRLWNAGDVHVKHARCPVEIILFLESRCRSQPCRAKLSNNGVRSANKAFNDTFSGDRFVLTDIVRVSVDFAKLKIIFTGQYGTTVSERGSITFLKKINSAKE